MCDPKPAWLQILKLFFSDRMLSSWKRFTLGVVLGLLLDRLTAVAGF